MIGVRVWEKTVVAYLNTPRLDSLERAENYDEQTSI
jgi:hypothetical protein